MGGGLSKRASKSGTEKKGHAESEEGRCPCFFSRCLAGRVARRSAAAATSALVGTRRSPGEASRHGVSPPCVQVLARDVGKTGLPHWRIAGSERALQDTFATTLCVKSGHSASQLREGLVGLGTTDTCAVTRPCSLAALSLKRLDAREATDMFSAGPQKGARVSPLKAPCISS